MSQQFDGPIHPFPVTLGSSFPAFSRVKLSAGVLALAVAGDEAVELGTLEKTVIATDTEASVRLRGAQGTRKMICAAAVTAGAIYAAASGQISNTVVGDQIGIAFENGSGANSIIECYYNPPMLLKLINLADVKALTPAQGSIPYFGAAGAFAVLAPSTSGEKLTTEGAAANPIFS
jgi:hypothetical protein